VEIPLFGKKIYLDKQHPPLLDDWFFTSSSWTISYPNTTTFTLVSKVRDHTPCIIEIATDIPKGIKFHFENYWMEHEHFFRSGQSWLVFAYFSDRCNKKFDS